MKLTIALVAFVAFSVVAYLRRKEQRGTYRKVAEDLGLRVEGHAFSGTLGDYAIKTEQIRRRQSRYSSVGSKVLQAQLLTAPRDLNLDRESLTSTIARKVGKQDVQVHDKPFDDTFRISCHDTGETLAWLGNEARRDTLMQLHELVDSLDISGGWLEIEVPTDPVEEQEIRQLLEWFVAVARRLDEPVAAPLPPPKLTLRARRSSWAPAIAVSLAVLPFLIGGGVVVYMFWSLGPFEKPEPRESIAVWTDGRGMSIPAKDEFIRCVDNTPKSPDVDFAECDELGKQVNLAFREVREAYTIMQTVKARRAARVDLDRDEVDEILQGIVAKTRGTSGHEKFVAGEIAPQFWELGLRDRYREVLVLDPRRDEIPMPAVTLDFLHTGGAAFGSKLRDRYSTAMRCLEFERVVHRGYAKELVAACGGRTRFKWRRSGSERQLVTEPEVLIAALEYNPHDTPKTLEGATPGLLPPEVELAWYVHRQTEKGKELERPVTDPTELAPKLDPVTCPTPWSPDGAFGEPAHLRAAAESAGPLADRLRLYAARQRFLFGEHDKAREALVPVTTGAEGVCAAQLESAMGSPDDALERLSGIEESHGGSLSLARAYAQALTGAWEDAYSSGHEALAEVPKEWRDHAAMVVIAAATKLGRDDGLDEVYGPIPGVGDLRRDPVEVTRWLGRASRDDLADASDRWIAPDMPLLVGAEPLQFVVAQELAGEKDAELWLDILLPDEFEVIGVAIGRRLAAELRADDEAAAAWRALEQGHLARANTPVTARVFRIARRYQIE